MTPSNRASTHSAYPFLLQYAEQGCPVDCGRPWTLEELEAAIAHGCHPSAAIPEASKCLREETLTKVKEGFARIISWEDIKKNGIPPNLKVSPIAAIPHKSRNFRMILDLSYQLKIGGERLQSVNDSSNKNLALQVSMAQLGSVLPRLISAVAHAPSPTIPITFAKLDIKDGYWRMVVSDEDAWNFCYVLPPAKEGDPPQLVVPASLQMGWSESPPFFCAASETARNLAATALKSTETLKPHPMESLMLPLLGSMENGLRSDRMKKLFNRRRLNCGVKE